MRKLKVPTAIPKNVSSGSENVSESAPDLEGVHGGVPGGVFGGQIGGVIGGVLGETGAWAPTPPPAPRLVQKIVLVGSHVKAPRQTYSMDPVYPPLAREARIWGTVVVNAVIDEHGKVVQAHVLNGHPLLIAAEGRAAMEVSADDLKRPAGLG